MRPRDCRDAGVRCADRYADAQRSEARLRIGWPEGQVKSLCAERESPMPEGRPTVCSAASPRAVRFFAHVRRARGQATGRVRDALARAQSGLAVSRETGSPAMRWSTQTRVLAGKLARETGDAGDALVGRTGGVLVVAERQRTPAIRGSTRRHGASRRARGTDDADGAWLGGQGRASAGRRSGAGPRARVQQPKAARAEL